MNANLRKLALIAVIAALGACQQAVRPDPAPQEPVASTAPESIPLETVEVAVESTLQPVAEAAAAPAEPVADIHLVGRGEDVFARIRRNLDAQSCAADTASERWSKRYAGNPAEFARHLENILPLLDFVSIEVERSGLPSEFVFIPLVESWYKPDAIGPGGPAGMWQMISSTARNHGIHIKPGYDGRLSPVESTRAALSYLETLQGMFGDWQAIVMAYNAGEGRMMGAFRRSQTRDVSAAKRKPHGLSNTTYDYVSKLRALACLIAEPEKHGLQLPLSARFVPLAPVLMDADVKTLEQFAARRGQDVGELQRLNPGYKNGRIVAGVPRLVLARFGLPVTPDSAAPTPIAAAPDAAPRHLAATHEVRAGDSLWSISRLYSVSIEELRSINQLGSGSVVQPGQTLKLVP